jgi:tetratricopeptide (TPR) repeat protein
MLLCGLGGSLQSQELDRLEVAQLLIQDKNFDRASKLLVDARALLDEDEIGRWELLSGLVELRKGKHDEALRHFQKVEDEEWKSQKDVYLLECYMLLGKIPEMIEAIAQVSDNEGSPASIFQLKAQAFHTAQDPVGLFQLLDTMSNFHPENASRLKIHYFLEMGLHLSATEHMREYLSLFAKTSPESEKISAQFANAFWARGDQIRAIDILELASIQWPLSSEIKILLSRLYRESGRDFVAKDLAVSATYLDSVHLEEAIAIHKRGGWHAQAENLSVLVSDPRKKLRHRLELLVGQREFGKVRSLHSSLALHSMYDDDEVLYASGYSFILSGEYERSIRLLRRIKDQALLSKSVKLIELARNCKEKPWICHATL